MIGNVPFADVRLDYRGQKLPLHDFFFAKSVDALKPGGVLALVTSHFTLDKQNAAIREYLADRADFLGAIRLPSDAFKREGTRVVTDIVFLRKRAPGEPARHADPDWLEAEPLDDRGRRGPDQPLLPEPPGDGARHLEPQGHALRQGFSVAVERRPRRATRGGHPAGCPKAHARHRHAARSREAEPAAAFTPPPPERHITEGSFFVGDDRVIRQVEDGKAVPVTYGGTLLKADGTLTGKRLAALIGLRDLARRVLHRRTRAGPRRTATRPAASSTAPTTASSSAYGPINKTTFAETADGTVIRRMPNLVKFREDPDAMLVMSLEEYDEVTGKAKKAADHAEGRGRHDARRSRTSPPPRKGLLVSLDRRAAVDLPFIAELYGKPERAIIAELGDLIYRDPEPKAGRPPTTTSPATSGRSWPRPRRPGRRMPATPRPCGPSSPRTCCPATSTPTSVHRGYPSATSRRSPPTVRRRADRRSRSAT